MAALAAGDGCIQAGREKGNFRLVTGIRKRIKKGQQRPLRPVAGEGGVDSSCGSKGCADTRRRSGGRLSDIGVEYEGNKFLEIKLSKGKGLGSCVSKTAWNSVRDRSARVSLLGL